MAEDKNLTQGHRARLRARILADPQSAYSYELLELLLGYVHLRSDTRVLAKTLLERYGGMRGLFAAHPSERGSIPGCGPSTEVLLTLIREIIARYFTETVLTKKTVTAQDMVQLGITQLSGLQIGRAHV